MARSLGCFVWCTIIYITSREADDWACLDIANPGNITPHTAPDIFLEETCLRKTLA